MNQKFIDFMQNYKNQRLAVAVSGGVDSICLLHWLIELKLDIVVLHVNHQLRSVADIETEYVRDLCKQHNIPSKIFYWDSEKPISGLEEAARIARYKYMTNYCHDNNIDTLIVAHQADDQIETFLMNLARGSGIYGLSAMQPVSYKDDIKIIRPLLNVSRDEIKAFCDKNNIKYFVDEMNSDEHYTRVRIRKNRYLLNEKLGISDTRILLAIENLNRTRTSIENDITNLINSILIKNRAIFTESFLFDLAPEIRLKLLGTLIQKIGGKVYQPRLKSLTNALERLHNDTKFTLGNCTIRRLGDKILIVLEGNKTTFRIKRNEKTKR